MAVSSTDDFQATIEQSHDRMRELKAFDDTKAGVKGLVDAGISEVPRIFIHPEVSESKPLSHEKKDFIFPVIDLENINKDPVKHKAIVKEVGDAAESWGFFQVINHGIPLSILDRMLQGSSHFFEQDVDVKKQYYHRDYTKRVIYNSNYDLYSPNVPAAKWRDALYAAMAPGPFNPEELPEACREIAMDYSYHVMKMGAPCLSYCQGVLVSNQAILKQWDALRVLTLCAITIQHAHSQN